MVLTVHWLSHILGDPGVVSRVDKMFVVKVYCKIDLTVNFHHEHFTDPTNCPWVSEDGCLTDRSIDPSTGFSVLLYFISFSPFFLETKLEKFNKRSSATRKGV